MISVDLLNRQRSNLCKQWWQCFQDTSIPVRPIIIWPYYCTILIIQISLLWSCQDPKGIIYGPVVQSMIGLESYMVQSMISLESFIFVPNAGDMQSNQKFPNIEHSQLYRLRAKEAHSTFCICERNIAGQNSVMLWAEIKTNYSHSICSQPLLSK